jgi:microcin C transport system substrate-binding protein
LIQDPRGDGVATSQPGNDTAPAEGRARRRRLIGTALVVAGTALLMAVALTTRAPAQTPAQTEPGPWRHALSLMGTPKQPADFRRLDYVNPDAPKGGMVRIGAQGTFDNFNPVVAGLKGVLAAGATQIYDTLMEESLDEVSTEYGLLAEAVRYPADYSAVTYRLRPNARWHDGRPVTADDVVWSFEVQKANSPFLAQYYRHVKTVAITAEREITFTFDQSGNRELPQIVGQLRVLPKHWWTGTAPDGRPRDITGTTLEPPLGSGPYRIKSFSPGRSVVLERVPDYWGKDVPVMVGKNNFDELRYEYFRDTTVALEAFKKGDLDFRTENVSRNWSTAYDFPAVRENRVIREEFPIRNLGRMQAFVMNLRRPKFADWRVRRAFDLAFDFEEMNRQLFFGLYRRGNSYFAGTELASSGVPEGQELAMLETVRDKVPPALFTQAYRTPVNGSPDAVRGNLREALGLLREAGWGVRDQKLVNATTGERFTVEILIDQPVFERVALFFKPNLERLGVEVTVRTVDDAQFENRLRAFDFDMLGVHSWGQSLSPGNEQRDQWSSESAERPGSQNVAGIRNPAVDALIERVIFARDRAELIAATRALDRVLLWNHYVIPQWISGVQWTARWDRFSRPERLPEYGLSGFPTIWWFDAAKAARAEAR